MKPLNLLLSSLATVMFFHHAQSQTELNADVEIESTCQQFTHETQTILRETMASVSNLEVENVALTAPDCVAKGVTLPPTPSPVAPSEEPSTAPSTGPSSGPSSSPSTSPSTPAPTTQAPVTSDPTQTPATATPSSSPSRAPISPSRSPSDVPTLAPTVQPTSVPTLAPTDAPSSVPSTAPSSAPATAGPTIGPSATPTKQPLPTLPRRMLSQKARLLNTRRNLLQSAITLRYTLTVNATDEQRVTMVLEKNTFLDDFKTELAVQIAAVTNPGSNTTVTITVTKFTFKPPTSCTITRNMPTSIVLLSGTGSTFVLAAIIVIIVHCQRQSGKSFRHGRSKQEKKHQSELELAIQKRQQKGSGARSAAGSTVDIFAEGDGLTTGGGTGLNEGNVDRARGKSELAFYDL